MGVLLGRQPGFNALHLPSIDTRPIWLDGSILLAQEHRGRRAGGRAVQLIPVPVCPEPGLRHRPALRVAARMTSFPRKPFPKRQRSQTRTGLLYTAQEKADFQTAGGAGKLSALGLASPSRARRGGTKTMCPRWLPHAAQCKTAILPFLFFFLFNDNIAVCACINPR